MIRLACASLVLTAVRTALGAPDGANPQDLTQPQKPAEVAEVSAASLADLSRAARAIGIPLPPVVTVGGIERQFPFIGAGGLDAKRPIGVIYFARPDWNVALGDGVAIVLPMKPDAAPLSSFIDAGGMMVPGHPDTDEPGHHLAALVNLPSRGKMSGLVTGQVDLEQAWTVVSLWPNSGLANIPPESRDALSRAVKGQLLDFTANGEGESLAIGVSVPQAILKQIAGLLLGGQ